MKTPQPLRHYAALDLILHSFGQMLAQFYQKPFNSPRPSPASLEAEVPLSSWEQRQSQGLMRVNHAGEIAAQGLYVGQALLARDPCLQQHLLSSALEEADHLAWCQQRLRELHSHTTYLAPLWYIGSFGMGVVVGLWGDKLSLGFITETERQVSTHLELHLGQLPAKDHKSKKVLETMRREEEQHAQYAQSLGATTLVWPLPTLMRWTAKIMTTTAYYV